MEPDPDNVPLVENPDAETLFEGQTWGWDGIDFCAVAAQNQNEPPFKKWLDPPKPLLHWHITTLPPYQMVENRSYPINVQGYKLGRY